MIGKQPQRIEPGQVLRIWTLRNLLRDYLAWECGLAEQRNRDEVIVILKKLVGSIVSPAARDRDWERLAESTLVIGSKALDTIEHRLRAIVGERSHAEDVDFRSVAHQIHSMTNQARKLKNSVALRRKCARAVLDTYSLIETDSEVSILNSEIRGSDEMKQWAENAFKFFAERGRVSDRFLDTYLDEWERFCEDAFDFLWSSSNLPAGYHPTIRYEKYIAALIQESERSKVNWMREPSLPMHGGRPDFEHISGVTVELKKRPDHFSFQIKLPVSNKNLRDVPFAIMGLLENRPGFHSVDISHVSGDSRNIKIDIWDKYTMDQISIAQDEILEYFGK